MIKNNTNTETTKPKYRYLNAARINSTIKKYGLKLAYTKNDGYFYFLDLETGTQVGENVMIARMHHFTIQQWREAAQAARGQTPANESEADVQVRELVSNLEPA